MATISGMAWGQPQGDSPSGRMTLLHTPLLPMTSAYVL